MTDFSVGDTVIIMHTSERKFNVGDTCVLISRLSNSHSWLADFKHNKHHNNRLFKKLHTWSAGDAYWYLITPTTEFLLVNTQANGTEIKL